MCDRFGLFLVRPTRRRDLRAAFVGHVLCGCLVLTLWVSLSGQNVQAQAPGLVAGINIDGDQPVQHPFLLPTQPTEIGEAIEDFRRFAGRKQWEKAFKHLQKVFEAKSTGLVLTDSGIMLPSRLIAREALLELPPAGQDAYRIFFDAEAKKLLEQATGTEELSKLTQIFTQFLVTSVGDEAANRLGDLHFEAGNFAQAVNAWRSILEERPDSSISRAKLRVKMAVGLARLKRWGQFRQLFRVIEEQHAQEKLTIGGKEVSPVDYLRPLLEMNPASVASLATTQQTLPADIPLAHDPAPLWQFRFFPHHDPLKDNQTPGLRVQQNFGWWGGGGPQVSEALPPVVFDEDRVYVNFVGYALGIDQASGKLLWRSGRFLDAPQNAQQGKIQSVEQFGLALGGDRSWFITTDSKANNNQQNQFPGNRTGMPFGLWVRENTTGKDVLSSPNISDLKDWNLRGNPLFTSERVFICANKTNQNPAELYILALNPKDARLMWSTLIGTYVNEQQNYYYGMMERATQPSLLIEGDRLYVDSQAGSLVQIDVISGQVDWGLNYTSDPKLNGGWWGRQMSQDRLAICPPQMVHGVLYVKGMRSRRLYAVDPQRPKVLWSRPVEKPSTLLGVDEERFYLGGDEISAYDLETRKILWSANVLPGTSWTQPLITQTQISSFSPRGIYVIDKSDGKLVHLFRGTDPYSLGGQLIVAPKCLLAVSNLAVTAYPLSSPAAATARLDYEELLLANSIPHELRAVQR